MARRLRATRKISGRKVNIFRSLGGTPLLFQEQSDFLVEAKRFENGWIAFLNSERVVAQAAVLAEGLFRRRSVAFVVAAEATAIIGMTQVAGVGAPLDAEFGKDVAVV